MVCSAGDKIIVFKIIDGGKNFEQEDSFTADYSLKNPTIVVLFISRMRLPFTLKVRSSYVGEMTLLSEYTKYLGKESIG